MYSAPIWQKENNNNNRILYEEARSVVSRKKDENGKTKTDLIRDFIDFKGDKWKYLINHPKTRMALCTSGDVVFNTINLTDYSYFSYPYSISVANGYIKNTSSITLPNGANAGFYVQTFQVVKFPVQFGISMLPNGGGSVSTYNFAFTSYPYTANMYLGYQPLVNNNPFGAPAGEKGFSICTTNITPSNMYYASVGRGNSGNLTSQTQTPIPGWNANILTTPTIYFRFFQTGDKIGWSTNGTSWTYWNPPVTYNTDSLYFMMATSNTSGTVTFNPNTVLYSVFNVAGALTNAQ